MTQIAREVDERMQALEPAAAAVLEKTIREALETAKPATMANRKRRRYFDLPPFDLKLKPGIDPAKLEQQSWDY